MLFRNLMIVLALGAGCLPTRLALGQEREEFGYNVHSLRPVHHCDQLVRRTLWWRIDGREKPNRPLFAKNAEITRIIIEAVKAGIIRPYLNDSLRTRMSQDELLARLRVPTVDDHLTPEEREIFGNAEADPWGDPASDGPAEATPTEWLAKELYILELKEDWIFDKTRGVAQRDLQSLTIYLPAEKNMQKAIEQPIATFSYRELVENVFRDNPDAIWYNPANAREHRNLAESFALRLFSAHLTKYSNGDDATIEDVLGVGKASLVASMQVEHDLLDFEAQLWEY
jgi:gliding motility associated protien GldN